MDLQATMVWILKLRLCSKFLRNICNLWISQTGKKVHNPGLFLLIARSQCGSCGEWQYSPQSIGIGIGVIMPYNKRTPLNYLFSISVLWFVFPTVNKYGRYRTFTEIQKDDKNNDIDNMHYVLPVKNRTIWVFPYRNSIQNTILQSIAGRNFVGISRVIKKLLLNV